MHQDIILKKKPQNTKDTLFTKEKTTRNTKDKATKNERSTSRKSPVG